MFAHRVSPPAFALKVAPVALQGAALHSSTRCARYSRQTCSRSSPLCKRCCYFFMKRTRHAEEDIFCDTLQKHRGLTTPVWVDRSVFAFEVFCLATKWSEVIGLFDLVRNLVQNPPRGGECLEGFASTHALSGAVKTNAVLLPKP